MAVALVSCPIQKGHFGIYLQNMKNVLFSVILLLGAFDKKHTLFEYKPLPWKVLLLHL